MRPFTPILLQAHKPGPMTGRGNNTYLLFDDAGGDGALIDAGVGEPRHLDSIAQELHARHAALGLVIVTHAHRDHIAGAGALAGAYPRAVFLKYPSDGPADGVPWRPLADGDGIRIGGEILQVIHTPGHAPDHVALWHAPTRAAWVGDLVIAGASVMIDWSRGGRMAAYLDSLRRLIALDARTLYPAHGPVITSPGRVLSGLLAHRLEREAQVAAALSAGQTTVRSITDSIYDGLDALLVPAARETIRAHLEKLKDEGRAAAAADRWMPAGTDRR